jgi:nicotinamide-nucleotide amidase
MVPTERRMMSSQHKATPTPDAETLSPVLPDDIIELAMSLLETASKAKIGIATAESCTGGVVRVNAPPVSKLVTDL